MTNRLIVVAVLSLGMIAMNRSASIWQEILAQPTSETVQLLSASHLFTISNPKQTVYSSPDSNKPSSYVIQGGGYGMALLSHSEADGTMWCQVVLQKENGKYFFGWLKQESLTPLPLASAPQQWVNIHRSWGW